MCGNQYTYTNDEVVPSDYNFYILHRHSMEFISSFYVNCVSLSSRKSSNQISMKDDDGSKDPVLTIYE